MARAGDSDAQDEMRRRHRRDLVALGRYRRLVDFVAAAMLYLDDNVRLTDPLRREHLKPSLKGHWELVPGRNATFAHLNRLARDHALKLIFIKGAAGDAVSTPANLWADGTLGDLDARWSRDGEGLARLVRGFAWPTPFTARAGREAREHPLTYCLHAAGTDPDCVVAALVGGDAVDGFTWHVNDLLDPTTAGAVLPMLHLSEELDYDAEPLAARFYAEGFAPRIVTAGLQFEIHVLAALEDSLARLRALRADASPPDARWPLLILVVPPGHGMAPELKHELFEPADRDPERLPGADARANPDSLRALERWLRSYKVDELLDERGAPQADIQALCPTGEGRLGMRILEVARQLSGG